MKYFYPIFTICLVIIIGFLTLGKQNKEKKLTTPISDIKFTQIKEDSPDSKISYKFNGEDKELIKKNFVAAGTEVKYYDFDKDGQNEVFIYTTAGANHFNGYVFNIDEKGNLKEICTKDFDQSTDNLGKEITNCYFYGSSVELKDFNDDGYMDIITSDRDFNTNYVLASVYRIYVWSKDKNMFLRD
ncbi:MAG: hypothetical protein PHR39_01045 [Actinomycetota bacterium]|nr:hypothetical protein [Actinomycetota bacterium]